MFINRALCHLCHQRTRFIESETRGRRRRRRTGGGRRTIHSFVHSLLRRSSSNDNIAPITTNKTRVIVSKLSYHEHEIEIKRSKFVAKIASPATEKEALEFIKSNSDLSAAHNCFAYRCSNKSECNSSSVVIRRSSDDGEPSGTAGIPILNVLDGYAREPHRYENVVALVTRYYGGIELGKGGLSRAYTQAVKRAFDSIDLESETKLVARREVVVFANVEEPSLVPHLFQALNEAQTNRFVLDGKVKIIEEEYDDENGGCSLELLCDYDYVKGLESALNEATKGRVQLKVFDKD